MRGPESSPRRIDTVKLGWYGVLSRGSGQAPRLVRVKKRSATSENEKAVQGTIEAIYIAPSGGAAIEKLEQIETIAHRGLAGDRYCEGTGYWSGTDECQVTLIEAEDLEAIQRDSRIKVLNGEHRRNLVVRDLRLGDLAGKQFRIGTTVLEYDRPRPPCAYIQSLTEPGMTKALLACGGICARVVESGVIRVGDAVVVD